MHMFEMEEMDVETSTTFTTNVELRSYAAKDEVSTSKVKIAEIPCVSSGLIAGTLIVCVKPSVSGSLKLEYSCRTTEKIHWTPDTGLTKSKDTEIIREPVFSAAIELKFGGELAFRFGIGFAHWRIDFFEIAIEAGIKGTIEAKIDKKEDAFGLVSCVGLKLALYLDATVKIGLLKKVDCDITLVD